jgi:hypothetical protein
MKTGKFILLSVISAIFSLQLSAQQLEKGSHVISPGFGLGGLYPVFSQVNYQTPLFGISYEYGAFEKVGPGSIGIGGFFGYKAFKRVEEIDGIDYYEKLHYFVVGGKGAYHYNPFPQVKKLDTYAGVMLSFNLPDHSANYAPEYEYLENTYKGYLAATIYTGARYYFNDYVGAFAEVGFGTSFFSMGANFKF